MKKGGTTKKKQKGDRSTPKGFAGALRNMQMNAFHYAGTIRPGQQSPQRVVVEESIAKPDYHADGMVSGTVVDGLSGYESCCIYIRTVPSSSHTTLHYNHTHLYTYTKIAQTQGSRTAMDH